MSNQYGGGLYGMVSGGAPIGLTPQSLMAMIVDPTIRALLANSTSAPDQSTTQGLMNWAGSQGRSSRAILPTISGLTVPAQIQQALRLPTLAASSQALNPGGNPNINPTTGQYTPPSGAVAGAPTSQQAPSSAPTSAPSISSPTLVDQIVAKAVAMVLSEGGGGPTSGESGAPGPEVKAGGGGADQPSTELPGGGGGPR